MASKIILKRFVTSKLETNTYVVCREGTCIVIDPGENIEDVISYLKASMLKPIAILITHGHPDHFAGAPKLKKAFPGAVIYMSFLDLEVAEHLMYELYPELYSYLYNSFYVEKPLGEGRHVFGSIEVESIATPGHSPGSKTLYIRELGAAFTGDTLFAGSVGTTHFLGGSEEMLLKSICKLYNMLPLDTAVYPGHGPETTLRRELEENIYVKSAIKSCTLG